MAAATLVRGREEGGGGSRRREEGGGKKREASGTAAAAAGEGGGAGAERSGASPAPSLRLGAGARFWPPLPALGGEGEGEQGWVGGACRCP